MMISMVAVVKDWCRTTSLVLLLEISLFIFFSLAGQLEEMRWRFDGEGSSKK
jgi:hypothetical protein